MCQDKKWKLIDHQEVENPYYEVTNGPISITVDDEDLCNWEESEDAKAHLQTIVDKLNECNAPFRSENKLELDLHIESQMLRMALEEIKEKAASGIFPHLPVENVGAAMCIEIEKIASDILQQWNAGKETKYEGSVITEPAPGIALGCISPEARELLDAIMEQWEGHYKNMKEMHGDAMPETTFYGFAYWLVRWSGLIQPAATGDRPCPHCGKELNRDRNLCCRECGKEVEPVKEIEYMPIHPDDANKFDCPTQIPMYLLNEEQAERNHGQSLKQLKERGGLSVKEILAIVGKKNWSYYRSLQWKEAIGMLNDIISNPTK